MNELSSAEHDRQAVARARQALRCLPFRLRFYQALEQGALSSRELAARSDWMSLSRRRFHVNRTEDQLIWLIQLGVLRREVDGQGLTERVRLTPLGRTTIAPWQDTIPAAHPWTRLRIWLLRHRPRL